MNKIIYITLLLFVISLPDAYGQAGSPGTPYITNYKRSVYHASTQNWSVVQSGKGVMYFANNSGVLEFDGARWNLIGIPNRSIVRSLLAASDGRIYVGAFSEFGYIESDSVGSTSYRSMTDLLPSDAREINDIWRIIEHNGKIIFQAYEALVFYNPDDNSVSLIYPEGQFAYAEVVNNNIYINDTGAGLLKYNGSILTEVTKGGAIASMDVWSILPSGSDSLLIGTQDDGYFVFHNGELSRWDTPANDYILKNKLYRAKIYRGQYLLLGSIVDGLFITDNKGNLLKHLNIETGLQSNTILAIEMDAHNNLWLGLDNGIDYVELNSPLSQLGANEGLGQGYASIVHEDRLYLGTNQGLFRQEIPYSRFKQMEDGDFELVPGTSGQIWFLYSNGQELLIGHNKGTFSLMNGVLEHISTVPGGWMVLKPAGRDDILLQGNYNALSVLRKGKNGSRTRFVNTLQGFNESCRTFLEDEDGIIWMSHGYKGIYRIVVSPDYKQVLDYSLYTSKDGLPSDYDNELVKLRGQIRFYNGQGGFYHYNPVSDKMEPNIAWDNIFGRNYSKIIPSGKDSFWYVRDGHAGYSKRLNDSVWTKDEHRLAPLSNHFVDAFENFYEADTQNVFIGIDEGFIHYNTSYSMPDHFFNFTTLVNTVEVTYGTGTRNETKFFYPVNMAENMPSLGEIPYKKTSLNISFISPFYQELEEMEYQVRLDDLDEEWSEWSHLNQKTYTNLREGNYIFRVRGRNLSGHVSEPAVFSFRINPPWFRTWYAYSAYVLLAVIIALVINTYYSKIVDEERQKVLADKHKELQEKDRLMAIETENAGKEIMQLRNEKLRADIRHKSKELANSTMGLIQKNRILTELKEELNRILKNDPSSILQYDIRKLLRKINKNIHEDDQWKVFETNFDKVHENFLKSLQENYPELTPKDLRLCAYLKMNLQTKEIAPLMNISVRGVEISRYRLRKKLKLGHDVNLTEFMMKYDLKNS